MTFTKNLTTNRFYVTIRAVLFCILFFSPITTLAQQPCTITSIWHEGESSTREVDCADPFGVAAVPPGAAQLVIDGEVVSDGDSIVLEPGAALSAHFIPTPNTEHLNYSTLDLYRHDDTNYILNYPDFRTIVATGTYTAVLYEGQIRAVFNETFLDKIRAIFIPTAYAQSYEDASHLVTVVTFTVIPAQEPPPPLSPLLLKYEPILRFHEHEDYFPMNVDAFVAGSGLWDSAGINEQLIAAAPQNALTLDFLGNRTPEETENWYIKFDESFVGLDLDDIKQRYTNLKDTNIAVPTYYAYEMEDSILGRDFIVLQYWYFYAMNNWGEYTNFGNNHEGDWESIFVFLNKETEEPEYVAFSSHLNDGFPQFNPLEYTSVRRKWIEVEKEGDQVVSYSSLGSHANYYQAGEYNGGRATDEAFGTGEVFASDVWGQKFLLQPNNTTWLVNYSGKFGANRPLVPGGSGPAGPYYSTVSNLNRFSQPLEWAGIDLIAKYEVTVEMINATIDFVGQNVSLLYRTLEKGVQATVSVYEEAIHFGSNILQIKLLPKYWEFEHSNDIEFEVDVAFKYRLEELHAAGIDELKMTVYYYNDKTDVWEVVASVVDTINKTVTFRTNHFSIYTIGELPEDTPPENESEQGEVDSTGSEPSTQGGGQSTRTDRYKDEKTPQVLGVSSVSYVELQRRVNKLKQDWMSGYITTRELLLSLSVVLREIRGT